MIATLRKVFPLIRISLREWIEGRSPRIAAALAFYTLFSIAPLLIIAVAIAGVVFGPDAARGHVVGEIAGLIGSDGARMIEEIIENAWHPSTGKVATAFGLLTLLVGAIAVLGELQDALNSIWGVTARKTSRWREYLKTRFVSFTMILTIGFLLLVSLVLSATISALTGAIGGWLPALDPAAHLVDLVLSFGLVTVLFALLYKIVPDAEIRWRDVWPGAATTSALFGLGKLGFGFYLGRSGLTSSYGAAASLVVLMLWVYYSAQIFLLGAELTHAQATLRHGAAAPTRIAKRAPRPREAARPSARRRSDAARTAATYRHMREHS